MRKRHLIYVLLTLSLVLIACQQTPLTATQTPYEPDLDTEASTTDKADIGSFVWFDENRDGILQSGEYGIENIEVNLWLDEKEDGLPDEKLASQETDTRGKYRFNGLDPSQSYIIEVIAPDGYTFSKKNNPNAPDKNKDSDINPTTGLSDTIEVEAGKYTYYIDVALYSDEVKPPSYTPASLGSKVWLDANGDGVKQSKESGIPNITLNLWTVDSEGNPQEQIKTTLTDKRGYYRFTNLDPSKRYILETLLPDGYGFTRKDSPQASSEYYDSDINPVSGHTDPITLSPGTYAYFYNPGLIKGSTPPPPPTTDCEPQTVCGTVWLDDNGDGIRQESELGVEGVVVRLIKDGASNNLTYERVTYSDEDGDYGFAFDDLDSGSSYYIFVAPLDSFSLVDGRDSLINASTGESNRFTLDSTYEIDAGLKKNFTFDYTLDVFENSVSPLSVYSRQGGDKTAINQNIFVNRDFPYTVFERQGNEFVKVAEVNDDAGELLKIGQDSVLFERAVVNKSSGQWQEPISLEFPSLPYANPRILTGIFDKENLHAPIIADSITLLRLENDEWVTKATILGESDIQRIHRVRIEKNILMATVRLTSGEYSLRIFEYKDDSWEQVFSLELESGLNVNFELEAYAIESSMIAIGFDGTEGIGKTFIIEKQNDDWELSTTFNNGVNGLAVKGDTMAVIFGGTGSYGIPELKIYEKTSTWIEIASFAVELRYTANLRFEDDYLIFYPITYYGFGYSPSRVPFVSFFSEINGSWQELQTITLPTNNRLDQLKIEDDWMLLEYTADTDSETVSYTEYSAELFKRSGNLWQAQQFFDGEYRKIAGTNFSPYVFSGSPAGSLGAYAALDNGSLYLPEFLYFGLEDVDGSALFPNGLMHILELD